MKLFFTFLIFFLVLFFTNQVKSQSGNSVQPEFTSYQEPGANELVNTLTGDLSVNIPILEVPSPEGSFTIPLFYNAGIGLEQDASWVGLGWNINVGAIHRSVVQFPDDANGQVKRVIKKDDVLRGWSSNLGPLKAGWNTNVGHYGRFNAGVFNAYWDKENRGFNTFVGLGLSNGSVSFDPIQFAVFASTIISGGSTSFAAIAKSSAKSAAYSMGAEVLTSAFTDIMPTVDNNGIIPLRTKIQKKFLFRNFWYFIDHERDDKMYGTLYLHNIQTSTDNIGSIILTNTSANDVPVEKYFNQSDESGVLASVGDFQYEFEGTDYIEELTEITPTNIAKDQYRVMAPGISGSIEPYRVELGAIASPKDFTSERNQLALVPFENYKPQFKYKDIFSNTYTHHLSVDENGIRDINNSDLGLSHSTIQDIVNGNKLRIAKEDAALLTDRIENDRQGLENGFLEQGMNVKWFTNQELTANDLSHEHYLDHRSNIDRVAYRQQLINDDPKIADQIGAFMVTAIDGSRYYFTQPVYESDFYSKTEVIGDQDAYSEILLDDKFATLWLLTSIVGSDFHDQNNNGKADYEDFGQWVSFEYGQFSTNFSWRYPYGSDAMKLTLDGKATSYTKGFREQYYLDAIHTRTHSAIFLKQPRLDGKGAFYDHDNNPQTDKISSSSVLLKEIILLRKEDLDEAEINMNFSKSAFHSTTYNSETLPATTGDDFSKIWDMQDTGYENEVHPIYDFLKNKSIKSIVFNYDFSLADNAPNSFESSYVSGGEPSLNNQLGGKLTLKSISVYGHNGVKYYNDYRFIYENNPNYEVGKWDAWGMYNPNGLEDNIYSHATSDPISGTAWSLNAMVSPQGALTRFHYERDKYGYISGNPTFYSLPFRDSDWTDGIHLSNTNLLDITSDPTIKYSISYVDEINSGNTGVKTLEFSHSIQIDSIKSNALYTSYDPLENWDTNYRLISIDGNVLISKEIYGGDVRVNMVEVFGGDNQSYKTVYDYTNEGIISTGNVSREPDFIKSIDYNWQNHYDFPQTPVLYSKVSVLEGVNPSPSNYDSKTVYEFEVPNSGTVTVNQSFYEEENLESQGLGVLQKSNYHVKVKSSKIGRLKKIAQYDASGTEVFEQQYSYLEEPENHQGIYTEGTLLGEKVRADQGIIYNRFFRTTKVYYPSVLSSTTTTNREGISKSIVNRDWDFIAGTVTEKEEQTGNGYIYRTTIKPAYNQYPNMGPYTRSNFWRKHILSAPVEEYTYLIHNNIELGLIKAKVTEWNDSWNELRSLFGNYYDFTPGGYQHWLKDRELVYNGLVEEPNQDGTIPYSINDQYDFTNPDLDKWQVIADYKEYDQYSLPLEIEDVNGQVISKKTGYDNALTIIEVANANYEEIAFSGAEEAENANGFFAGEVKKGNGIWASKAAGHPVHTGEYSLNASVGQNAFEYETNKLKPNRKYRLYAWTTNPNGEINYQIDGGNIVSISARIERKAGDWYQISGIVEMPSSFNSFKAWCKGIDSDTYYDDFRLQPLDATGQSFVYDRFNQITFSLDNNNLFSKIEYDEQGRPIRVFQETFTGPSGKLKVWEKEYHRAAPTFFLFSEEGPPTDRCYTAELISGVVSDYDFVWTADGEIKPNGPDPNTFCLASTCFETLEVEIFKSGTSEVIESRTFYGTGSELVWLHGNNSIHEISRHSTSNEGLFNIEWNGGTAPYEVKWYMNGDLEATRSIPNGSFSAQYEMGDRCGYSVYATVQDACNNYLLTTEELSIENNAPSINLSIVESSTTDKVFDAIVSGGIERSFGGFYKFWWYTDGAFEKTEYGLTSSLDKSDRICPFSVRVRVWDKCGSESKKIQWSGQDKLEANDIDLQINENDIVATLNLTSGGVRDPNNGDLSVAEWRVDGNNSTAIENPSNTFQQTFSRTNNNQEIRITLEDYCGSTLQKKDIIPAKIDPCINDPCAMGCPDYPCDPPICDPCVDTGCTEICTANCDDLRFDIGTDLDLINKTGVLEVYTHSGNPPFDQIIKMDGSVVASYNGINSLNNYSGIVLGKDSQEAIVEVTDDCGKSYTRTKIIKALKFNASISKYEDAAAYEAFKIDIDGYSGPYEVKWELYDIEQNELLNEEFQSIAGNSDTRQFARDCYPQSVKVIVKDAFNRQIELGGAIFASSQNNGIKYVSDGAYVSADCPDSYLEPYVPLPSGPVLDQPGFIDPADLIPDRNWYFRCEGDSCNGVRTPIEFETAGINWIPIPGCDGYDCCDQFDLPDSIPAGTYDMKYVITTDYEDGYLLEVTKDTISLPTIP